jgi:hypothetical protein
MIFALREEYWILFELRSLGYKDLYHTNSTFDLLWIDFKRDTFSIANGSGDESHRWRQISAAV